MTSRNEIDNPWSEGRTPEGFFKTRIRAGRHAGTGKSQQLRVTIATTDEAVALSALARLRALSATLCSEGLTTEACVAIKKAASYANDSLKFELLCQAALEFAPVAKERALSGGSWRTFRELADAWTSGVLHRKWPDHVKLKDYSKDKGLIDYLSELVVDPDSKTKLGDMPLARMTFEHASAALRQLPPTCKRPAARRHYAQVIGRVMKLAVFPAAVIAASPLPRNFLPHIPEGDVLFQHFYPDEDLQLMQAELVDYAERCLFGLCNREGGRLGEFLDLKWWGVDAKRRELTLGMRKGGRPSKWKAEPGTIEALEPLRALGGDGPFCHLANDGKWSERLHTAMRAAKLEREALYHTDVANGFRRMRGHDTRATYVTIALALGLSEKHIMRRTGHRTSKMVHRYDHNAESWDSGCLLPLDEALGLPVPPDRAPGWVTGPNPALAARLARTLPAGGHGPLSLGPGEAPSGLSPEPAAGIVEALDLAPPGVGAALGHEPHELDGGGSVAGVDRRVRGLAEALEQYLAERHFGFTHDGSLRGTTQGETVGETVSGFSARSADAHDKFSGMISALVAPAGLEPACLAARDFKSRLDVHEGARKPVNPRLLVAGGDANAHGGSPEGGQVRRPDTPLEAPPDAVLVALTAAAHAAVDRGDAATVAAIMAALEQHRAPKAGAAG